MDRPSPSVFISYSHDTDEHKERVLALAELLRSHGIDAILDQYVESPGQGWPLWMIDEVERAHFVLVICTETYYQRFRRKAKEGRGKGVKWEGAIISQWLYDHDSDNTHFLPVLFSSGDEANVPEPLRGSTFYFPSTADGYEALLRRLTNQPAIRAAELGEIPKLPPVPRSIPLFESEEPRSSTGETPSSGALPPSQRYEELGIELVDVPAGVYPMGAEDLEYADPVHQVRLSAFRIGKYPVTRKQYAAFLAAEPDIAKPTLWKDRRFAKPRQPVVGVSWREAKAFCDWLGAALPTEAQWEAAARGPEGRRYPWGEAEPTDRLACFEQSLDKNTAPVVDALPEGQGPFGTWAQVGHIWEWCADAWDKDTYLERDLRVLEDPVYKVETAASHVVRGGAWNCSAEELRAANRAHNRAASGNRNIGFRICVPISEP